MARYTDLLIEADVALGQLRYGREHGRVSTRQAVDARIRISHTTPGRKRRWNGLCASDPPSAHGSGTGAACARTSAGLQTVSHHVILRLLLSEEHAEATEPTV